MSPAKPFPRKHRYSCLRTTHLSDSALNQSSVDGTNVTGKRASGFRVRRERRDSVQGTHAVGVNTHEDRLNHHCTREARPLSQEGGLEEQQHLSFKGLPGTCSLQEAGREQDVRQRGLEVGAAIAEARRAG